MDKQAAGPSNSWLAATTQLTSLSLPSLSYHFSQQDSTSTQTTTARDAMMARSGRLLVVAAVFFVLVLLLASPSPASARRRRRLPVRLRVYMHDIVGGPGQTAVLLVKGTGRENPTLHPGNHFGDTAAVDDLLTDGASAAGSAPVGRAQGTYMTASTRRPVFVVSVTLVLTAGPYNGSTLVVAGRDDTSEPVRELAVVGGTGKLRRAQGHVLWSTAEVVSPVYSVLELDVHASVPETTTTTTKAAAAVAMLAFASDDLTADRAVVE